MKSALWDILVRINDEKACVCVWPPVCENETYERERKKKRMRRRRNYANKTMYVCLAAFIKRTHEVDVDGVERRQRATGISLIFKRNRNEWVKGKANGLTMCTQYVSYHRWMDMCARQTILSVSTPLPLKNILTIFIWCALEEWTGMWTCHHRCVASWKKILLYISTNNDNKLH